MLPWQGFLYATAAAIGHSGIDATRKMASQRLSSTELVCLVSILDAAYTSLSCFVTNQFAAMPLSSTPPHLTLIILVSAALKVACGFMYQRALHVSPLSVTVPYLAFTPALIIVTSFFLVGEAPSFQGMAGVIIVTTGGYLLALESSNVKSQWNEKSKVSASPILPLVPALSKLPSSAAMANLSIPTLLVSGLDKSPGSHFQMVLNKSTSTDSSASPNAPAASAIEIADVAQTAVDTERGKGAHSGELTPARRSALELTAAVEDSSASWRRWRAVSRMEDTVSRTWTNLQKLSFTKVWNFTGSRLSRLAEPLAALRKEEGSVLMLGCAAILSITNSLDKLGAHASPSVLHFACLQRVAMAVPSVSYLLCTSPRSVFGMVRYFHVLSCISFFEILAIVGYLKSIQSLLVSYAVAMKRTNILMSVLVGKIVFKEKILRKFPFIAIMMAGMLCIVFASRS